MSITSAGLVDALRDLGILSPTQHDKINRALQGHSSDAQAVAKELLKRGWLTAYQANLVLKGRGAELVLGPYLLLERLGEGGMGQVFKARHQLMDRIVAIKVIRKERLSNADAVQRFHREIRTTAQLSHPNLVTAHDASSVGDIHFLVMEYAEGSDLHQLVGKSGPLPVAQACACIRQAALGLQHAAERGLVHRDVKPSNLQLTNQGKTVKVLDMGLARISEPEAGGRVDLTQARTVLGTPDFIAPEQIADPRRVDVRADVYSLGCTFYFLLAGRPPFPTPAWEEKLVCHRKVEPVPIEQIRPDVPAGVAAILRKMMAKRPEDRFSAPAAVADALAPFAAAIGSAPSAPVVAGGGAAWLPPALPSSLPSQPAPLSHSPSVVDQSGQYELHMNSTVAPAGGPTTQRSPAVHPGGPSVLRPLSTPPVVAPGQPPVAAADGQPQVAPGSGSLMSEGRGSLIDQPASGYERGWTLQAGSTVDTPQAPSTQAQPAPFPSGETILVGGQGPSSFAPPGQSPQRPWLLLAAGAVILGLLVVVGALLWPKGGDGTDKEKRQVKVPDGTDKDKGQVKVPDGSDKDKRTVVNPKPVAYPKDLLEQDFKKVDLGERPEGWVGANLGVAKDDEGRQCLKLNNPNGLHFVTLPKVAIKGNFVLECELQLGGFLDYRARAVGGTQEFHLELGRPGGIPLPVKVDHLGTVTLDTMDEIKAEKFKPLRRFQFRLMRKGDRYNVSINGNVTTGKSIPGKGTFEDVRLGLRDLTRKLSGHRPRAGAGEGMLFAAATRHGRVARTQRPRPGAGEGMLFARIYWVKISLLDPTAPAE